MITASSWMFISSFEKFRKRLLSRGSICSMIQQSTHGYAGVTVPTTMFVYACNRLGIIGSYIRLEDFDRPQWQEPRALEALANPECGWFYRADADGFGAIPGSPIAYWASKSLTSAFVSFPCLKEVANPVEGIKTGDNDQHLRFWFEVSRKREHLNCCDSEASLWRKMCKGGEYRKWYGNNEYVCRWGLNGQELISSSKACVSNREFLYTPAFNWTYISSGRFAARKAECDSLYNNKGPACYSNSSLLNTLLGALNSSYAQTVLDITSPTLDYKPGGVGGTPVPGKPISVVNDLVEDCIELSRTDWNAFEASWGFQRHPII